MSFINLIFDFFFTEFLIYYGIFYNYLQVIIMFDLFMLIFIYYNRNFNILKIFYLNS